MSKLVDDIVRERRRGGGDQAQKDLLNFMLAGVDKQTGESLSDENIRYQIITFLIAGHETTSGLLSFTLYFLVNNPDILEKAYEEVDRVLGSDIAVTPTFQQVNQLTYVQQILNESLQALADRAGHRALSLQGRGDRRAVTAEEEHLCYAPDADAASRLLGLGAGAGKIQSREFFARGGSFKTAQRLQALGQWPARLHRPPVRHAGGDAGDRHAVAALPAFRSQEIPAQAEGIAVDQAGRFYPQGEAAARPYTQRAGAGCGSSQPE
jgi:hypothetical protein